MSLQVSINGHNLQVEAGITILRAARENGIYVPTLCDFPGLRSKGSCRMCIVEIQGRANTPTACTTPVEDGMVVLTDSPKVTELRGELLQMLLSEHPSGCLFCPEKDRCEDCMVTLRKAAQTTGCRSCPKDDQCEFQEMVEKSGLARVGYIGRYRMLPVEKYDPFYDRDYNLCILCGRCIRACEELHFTNTLTYVQRGTETVVGTPFHRTHLESGCSFCGACVEACPTGALMEKTRKWDGKPEAATASTCPFCSLGCQIDILTKNGMVIGSLPGHTAGTDNLCVKGRFGITELVNHPARLKHPQIRIEHELLKMPWEETLQKAVEQLAACPPQGFEMLVSTDLSNENLFVAQKFTRLVMKSNRIGSSARQIFGEGLESAARLLKKSQPISALADASTILCLGFDGQYSQSVVEMALHQAKEHGARLISLNSEQHVFARYTDLWLRTTPERELAALEELAQIVSGSMPASPGILPEDSTKGNGKLSWQVELAGQELIQARSLVVLVGPAFLIHPKNKQILAAVERLAENASARIIALPEQGNLAGADWSGVFNTEVQQGLPEPQVVYLIGEDIPANLAGDPFIIYQNIFPPSQSKADLVFPMPAFTEEDGTLIDQSGKVHDLRAAMLPPGEALPAWEVLSRIARQMGAEGFDYASAADIRAEMTRTLGPVQPGECASGVLGGNASQTAPGSQQEKLWAPDQISEHSYLGFSLAASVDGLKMLYPQEKAREIHV